MNRLIFIVIFGLLITTGAAQAKQIGDFNGDGKISILDVLSLLQHLSGRVNVPEIGHETGSIIVDTVTVRDTVFTYEDGRYEGIFGTWSMLEPFTQDSIRYCFYPDGFYIKVEPTQIPKTGGDYTIYEAGQWDFKYSFDAGRWKRTGDKLFYFGAQRILANKIYHDSLEVYIYDGPVTYGGNWALFKRVRSSR